jgi:hypothetical protein
MATKKDVLSGGGFGACAVCGRQAEVTEYRTCWECHQRSESESEVARKYRKAYPGGSGRPQQS